MPPDDPLNATLLDLLYELRDSPGPLILGGGYGLYLKQMYSLTPAAPRTFLPDFSWPTARSTEDLDLLLTAELVSEHRHMSAIRAALDRLGFTVVERARFMQFEKHLDEAGGRVKVDFLTGPIVDEEVLKRISFRSLPRVRPRQKVELHAYFTPEALGFEDNLLVIPLSGARSTGDVFAGNVHVPQTLTFLLMKLHAFSDRKQDENKDLGRHHALDLYRIVAMMTESEYETAVFSAQRYAGNPAMSRAHAIVWTDFSDENSPGLLRLREHILYKPEIDLKAFISVLREFFAAN